MTRRRIFNPSLLLGIAFLAGVLLDRAYERVATPPTTNAVSVQTSRELTALREANHRLTTQVKEMYRPAPPATPTASALDPLRVLATLRQRKLVTPTLTVLGQDGALTPAFVELFAVTPSEQARLDAALSRTRARLIELEAQNATVTPGANGAVSVAIKAFPETGGAAYDALLATFADTLGAERQKAFLELGAGQVERSLDRFGLADRTLVFTHDSSVNGTMLYRVKENYAMPGNTGQMTSEYKSFAELAHAIGLASGLVPADFHP